MSYAGLLNQTATLYKAQSINEYGRFTASDSEDFQCRVEQVNETLLTPEGNTLQIVARVFFATDVSIENDDKLTFDSIDYKVVSVDKSQARNGLHHYEVKVIKWL